jgi:hypothetical protein
MTTTNSINIDAKRLFNLGANLIAAGFMKQKPTDAKKLFKELKQGEAIKGGQLKSEKTGAVIPIKLELQRKAYRGKFNYPNFEICIKALLQKFDTEVRKDKDLKGLSTLSNPDNGEILFNLPSGVQIDENINVLMMAVRPEKDSLIVKLIFMEPEQFISEPS